MALGGISRNSIEFQGIPKEFVGITRWGARIAMAHFGAPLGMQRIPSIPLVFLWYSLYYQRNTKGIPKEYLCIPLVFLVRSGAPLGFETVTGDHAGISRDRLEFQGCATLAHPGKRNEFLRESKGIRCISQGAPNTTMIILTAFQGTSTTYEWY